MPTQEPSLITVETALRLDGKTISKTRLSELYWNERKTLKEIGEQHGVSATAVWEWMRRLNINRRSKSQALLTHHNPTLPFQILPRSPEQELLRWVGAVLYWCEGSHREKQGRQVNTLTFTNADEDALKIWLQFLREVCRTREEKIRVRLFLHRDQDDNALLQHWSTVLGVPPAQFEHVTFTASNRKKSKHNHPGYLGTVKIKFHSQALVQQVSQWVEETKRFFLGRDG